jgi:hypothetical protein
VHGRRRFNRLLRLQYIAKSTLENKNKTTMNADLTFNSVVFKKTFDMKDESQRQSTTRGVTTPDQLIIKSQDYVDSATKVAGRRYTGRIDRTDIDANLQKILTSAYFVIAVPGTVTQAQLDVVVATFKASVADASLITAILNNEK